MAYIDAANYNLVKSMKGFPIGSIIPFSGSSENIPKGWIVCNGANIAISTYPLLYECIGNVYGGTADSTFKLPNLTANANAIVDQFQGHHALLQSTYYQASLGSTDAHKPEISVKSDDPYWKFIGDADNGNSGSKTSQNDFTTIDVFGEFTSKPNLVAKYGDFALTTGTVDYALTVVERKTSDAHFPNHTHAAEVNDGGAPSYSRNTNKIATQNSDQFSTDNYYVGCWKDGNAANVCRSTNDPPIDGTQMANVGASETVTTNYRKGGGQILTDNPVAPQYKQTTMGSGDGESLDEMYSHISGKKYFFSSLNSDASKFSQLTGHTHQAVEYKFESKINLINPGIVSDVSFNDVAIDVTPGKEFCTININAATPNLTAQFIIRAF